MRIVSPAPGHAYADRHVARPVRGFTVEARTLDRMGIIGWILIGLIMGALAKAALNKKGGSWLGSLLIGVVGALVGGALGSIAFNRGIGSFWSPWTWLLAFVGSVIVLAVWSAISGRSKA